MIKPDKRIKSAEGGISGQVLPLPETGPLEEERVETKKIEEEKRISGKGSSIKMAVFSLMLLSAFTKIFGFVREILLGRFFSISDTAEAYIIAQTIPSMLLMVVRAGLSIGFIPVFNRILMEQGREKGSRFLSNIINILLGTGVLFCLFVTVNPEIFVRLFASGFEGEKLALTIGFTQVAVWGVLFTLIVLLLEPYLQIHDNFWVPAMIGIPMNLVFYVSFLAGRYVNELFLPLGIVLAALVQVLWMLPFVHRQGYRWRPVVDLKDPQFRELLILAAPVTLGVAVNQINLIVDRTMASRVLDGGVAALNYASKMSGIVEGIFIYSIVVVFYPKISRLVIAKEFKAIEELATNAMVTMALIVIPCVAGLMVFSKEIIALLFQSGAFDGRAVALTSGALFYYAPGLIGYAFRQVIARIFYSMNDTKTPTWNAAVAVAINIVLNIALSLTMGINGLALATSISSLLSSILLIYALRRKGNIALHYRDLLSRIFRIGLAALLMGAAGYFLYPVLQKTLGPKIGVLLAIVVAAFVYGVLILFMRIPEVDEITSSIRQRLRRSK